MLNKDTMSDDEGVWIKRAKAANAASTSSEGQAQPLKARVSATFGALLSSNRDKDSDAKDVDMEKEEEPPAPPISYLSYDADLANRVRQGQVILSTIDSYHPPGKKLQIVQNRTMTKSDFFAYKETLKLCKPRFRFDTNGHATGTEKTWYRELNRKAEKDRQEPPQKRSKANEPESETGKSRKRRKKDTPLPPRPKQAKLEEQSVSVHEELARNINVDGLLFADIKRVISALRTTDSALKPVAMDIYQRSVPASIKVTLPVAPDGSVQCVLTDVRPSFEDLWVTDDRPEFARSSIPYAKQVLMHYSRASDPRKHAEICACWLWGKSDWMTRELSEVDLRDFIIHSLGDLFVTVESEDAIFIWWQNSWTISKGSFHRLGHMIMQAVRELYTIRQHAIWRLHVTDWIAKDPKNNSREFWVSEHRPDPLDALLHSLAKDKRSGLKDPDISADEVHELCKAILVDMQRETGLGEIIDEGGGDGDGDFYWVVPRGGGEGDGGGRNTEWLTEDIREIVKEVDALLDDANLTELLSEHRSSKNAHVRQLVVEQLHAYSLPRDPFDRKDHLFCFTNATFDLNLDTFVPVSKFDFCQMNCGHTWPAERLRPVDRVRLRARFQDRRSVPFLVTGPPYVHTGPRRVTVGVHGDCFVGKFRCNDTPEFSRTKHLHVVRIILIVSRRDSTTF